MMYEVKGGKRVRIPDEDIARLMKTLSLTKSEAVQVWLEDEGYEHNAEQEALEQKAKENRITATIHKARAPVVKKTQKERVQKEDATKEGIIQAVAELLRGMAQEVEIVNKAKLISFKVGEDTFKFDLIRQRPPKEK